MYFHCSPNNGLFTNIAHIELIQPPEWNGDHANGQSTHSHRSLDNGTVEYAASTANSDLSADVTSYSTLCKVTSVEIGDHVIWISNDNQYERGTVMWSGVLPQDDNVLDGEILVGIEFVSVYTLSPL